MVDVLLDSIERSDGAPVSVPQGAARPPGRAERHCAGLFAASAFGTYLLFLVVLVLVTNGEARGTEKGVACAVMHGGRVAPLPDAACRNLTLLVALCASA